eukprot:COSAG05_NODE_452_length_9699_cov_33.848125_5_plen_54_part_00
MQYMRAKTYPDSFVLNLVRAVHVSELLHYFFYLTDLYNSSDLLIIIILTFVIL